MTDRLLGGSGADRPVLQRHHVVRAADIDVVGLQPFAILGDLDDERALAGERLADGVDRQPLRLADRDDIGPAERWAQVREQLFQRAQRLGGHADPHHRPWPVRLLRQALARGFALFFFPIRHFVVGLRPGASYASMAAG